MPQSATSSVYYVAPFSADGELQGVGAWQRSALSPRWLDFCRGVLRDGGDVFHRPLPHPFERVILRFTSLGSAALVSLSLDGLPVSSCAYLRGGEPVAERELLQMFVQSLRGVKIVQQLQSSSQPFAQAFGISERPLNIVVAWGVRQPEDSDMMRELGAHLAGAFLYEKDAV